MADTRSFYRRKAEWQSIIDAHWGPGLPYSQKVAAFNTYADYIQAKFPCFEGLNLNWYSHRMAHAARITDSTSAGAFWAILSHLAYALEDMHAFAYDSVALAASLPPAQGTPMLGVDLDHPGYLGAGITPLPDSSLLVFKVCPNHPLGLQPGDIVVGYEGVPWHKLVQELLAGGLPLVGSNSNDERARRHFLLQSAGPATTLFDTIDVVKYDTGDTLHLPTGPMATWQNPVVMMCNEQLPIAGVPMPNYDPESQWGGTTYGIVDGTNVGYIYVTKHSLKLHDPNSGANLEFSNAVRALINTDGLIIDMRYNIGGNWIQSLYQGFSLIMNHDAYTIENWGRLSATDPVVLVRTHDWGTETWHIKGDPSTVYDRPIAVLLGPRCRSVGDYTAYRMRFIPNTRFFGKPTNGGFTGSTVWGPSVPGFILWCPDRTVRDYSDPARILVRHGVPVDEEVWLTRDDVARGDDTVVKRALTWINNLAHAHHVVAPGGTLKGGVDTVRLAARVENPNNHPLSVRAFINSETTPVDSCAFADDGLHGDGEPSDGIWGASWKLPAGEEMYNATVVTTDPVDTTVYAMPFSARFTTAGPVVFSSLLPERASRDMVVFRSPAVQNRGKQKTVPAVTGSIRMLQGDTVINKIYNWRISYGDIPPDSTVGTNQFFSMTLRSPGDTVRLRLAVEIASNGITYWRDTLSFPIGPFTAVAEQHREVPEAFALEQNYPNPFNPVTVIKYTIGAASGQESGIRPVRLVVYDILGREVAVLVNEVKAPGTYEVQFSAQSGSASGGDARGLASGVYVYRLTAGSFVESRKMSLIQ